jgi:hypothetical protein
MKKETKDIRNRMVVVRMNQREFECLEELFKATTSNQLSDYVRKILLKKPVIVKYRNQSADEILAVMIQLKNELNAIGNNFNQVVHRLHTLDRIPEIKAWLLTGENSRQSFMSKLEEIKLRMIEIYKIWSQK